MGLCPIPRQSFSRKRLDQKALRQKSIRFFVWMFLLVCANTECFYSREYSSQKIKSNITLSIFCPKVVPSAGANKFAKLGSSKGSLREGAVGEAD